MSDNTWLYYEVFADEREAGAGTETASIWRSQLNGNNRELVLPPVQVLPNGAPLGNEGGPTFSVSPDGDLIARSSVCQPLVPTNPSCSHVSVYDLLNGSTTAIPAVGGADDGQPVISPNDQFVAFTETLDNDSSCGVGPSSCTLRIYDLATHRSTYLRASFAHACTYPAWSPTSKSLLCVNPNADTLYTVDLATKRQQVIAEFPTPSTSKSPYVLFEILGHIWTRSGVVFVGDYDFNSAYGGTAKGAAAFDGIYTTHSFVAFTGDLVAHLPANVHLSDNKPEVWLSELSAHELIFQYDEEYFGHLVSTVYVANSSTRAVTALSGLPSDLLYPEVARGPTTLSGPSSAG
jgi:hypothetical protein